MSHESREDSSETHMVFQGLTFLASEVVPSSPNTRAKGFLLSLISGPSSGTCCLCSTGGISYRRTSFCACGMF